MNSISKKGYAAKNIQPDEIVLPSDPHTTLTYAEFPSSSFMSWWILLYNNMIRGMIMMIVDTSGLAEYSTSIDVRYSAKHDVSTKVHH